MHHLRLSISTFYQDDPTSAGFASNTDEVVIQADLWIHLHVHRGFNYQMGDRRVVCKPLNFLDPEAVVLRTQVSPR